MLWLCVADTVWQITWQITLTGQSAILLFLGAGLNCKLQEKMEGLLIMHKIDLSLYFVLK
jgi:hypothetical protein